MAPGSFNSIFNIKTFIKQRIVQVLKYFSSHFVSPSHFMKTIARCNLLFIRLRFAF